MTEGRTVRCLRDGQLWLAYQQDHCDLDQPHHHKATRTTPIQRPYLSNVLYDNVPPALRFEPSSGKSGRTYYPKVKRNAGWPTGGDPYGHGALVVVRGRGKPVHMAKGRTGGFDGIQQGGMQNATSRNCTERHTRTRRTRIAAGEHLSAALQPELVPAGLRSHLLKPGSYDQGNHRRDRGRYVAGENRPHHRSLALRAVPVDAGATGQHSQA